ncbi:MAG: type II toxin-antitoxin system VapC family toxin [Actinobacteria bacterium]|nr:type II toxin-antitoxin system VapC family toxin [Actinomycetota bacterium]
MTLLLLDTTFLIDAERSDVEADRIIADEDDVAIAAISVAELRVGVELATPARREAREAFFNSIIETIPILDYDTEVALDHAALLAAMHSAGRPRGAHDLIIAATARCTSRTIISSDASAFADLPGVSVLT